MTAPESTPPRLPRQLSGASLGLVLHDDTTAADEDFDLSTLRRYRDAGVLGRGGMGEIRVTFDRRLGRDVAIKTPVLRGAGAHRQFVAEAKLTAKLVHPGIVAVHDAGLLPDGTPYYTMPIIDGRTLADALRDTSPVARLRLVRHFLDACEAVGYAHSEGIVHRDLKPANILIGRFGETIVVDWGLAGVIGRQRSAIAGTPSYMAPEQRAGDVLDARADVFALGVTLREIVTGSNVAGVSAGASPELMAVAERATQLDRDARYADGHALAEDVAAWFEGRRVAAHRYGVVELAKRVWSAHRVQLVATLLAIVGIAIAATIGYLRTAAERSRAQESERMAMAARARAEHSLAQAEVAQARGAMERSAWPDAELYAAGALTHGPSAQARGVLARFDTSARPRLIHRVALPGCTSIATSADGRAIACGRDNGALLGRVDAEWSALDTIIGDAIPIAVASAASTVVTRGARGHILAIDPARRDRDIELSAPGGNPQRFHVQGRWLSWISGTGELWADLESGTVEMTQSCVGRGDSVPAVVGRRTDGARVLVCQDGAVLVAEGGGTAREVLRLPAGLGGPIVLALHRSSPRFAALATANAEAVVIDLDAGRVVLTVAGPGGTPNDIALADARLAVIDAGGNVDVWEVSTGALAVRMSSHGSRVRWLDDGSTLRIIGPDAVFDYALGRGRSRAHLQHTPSGVAAVASSPDGVHLASAHGDGHIHLARVDGTEAFAALPLHWSVVKDVEFSPDGDRVAAVSAQGDELRVFDLADAMLPLRLPTAPGTRLSWLVGDVLVLATYQDGLTAWRGGEPIRDARLERLGRIVDLESDVDRRAATALVDGGEIIRLDAALEPTLVATREDAVAVAGAGRSIAVLRTGALEIIDDDAVREVALDEAGIDIAVSSDRRLIAIAHADGTASVWSARSLECLAILPAHAGRVASVAFDARSQWLVTGGWDGDVRQWSMHTLERSADELLAEIERDWGRTIDELLVETSGLGTSSAPRSQGS